jgi:hypothetical protein
MHSSPFISQGHFESLRVRVLLDRARYSLANSNLQKPFSYAGSPPHPRFHCRFVKFITLTGRIRSGTKYAQCVASAGALIKFDNGKVAERLIELERKGRHALIGQQFCVQLAQCHNKKLPSIPLLYFKTTCVRVRRW